MLGNFAEGSAPAHTVYRDMHTGGDTYRGTVGTVYIIPINVSGLYGIECTGIPVI